MWKSLPLLVFVALGCASSVGPGWTTVCGAGPPEPPAADETPSVRAADRLRGRVSHEPLEPSRVSSKTGEPMEVRWFELGEGELGATRIVVYFVPHLAPPEPGVDVELEGAPFGVGISDPDADELVYQGPGLIVRHWRALP